MNNFRQIVQDILDKSNLFKPKQQINISPEDKKIYEDKKWLIIQPSKIDNIWKYLPDLDDGFFYDYNRGYPPKPYYIILNKKNPSEKYYLDNVAGFVGKFKDSEYDTLDSDWVLKQHPEFKDVLRNNTKLNKINHLNRSFLDKEYNNLYNKNELEYEDWLNGVKTDKDFTDLYSVPEEYRTFDICYLCMKRLYKELGLHKKTHSWEYTYPQWKSFNEMLEEVPSKYRKDIKNKIQEEFRHYNKKESNNE